MEYAIHPSIFYHLTTILPPYYHPIVGYNTHIWNLVGGDWNHGILSQTDELSIIFQRGRSTTNQNFSRVFDGKIMGISREFPWEKHRVFFFRSIWDLMII